MSWKQEFKHSSIPVAQSTRKIVGPGQPRIDFFPGDLNHDNKRKRQGGYEEQGQSS